MIAILRFQNNFWNVALHKTAIEILNFPFFKFIFPMYTVNIKEQFYEEWSDHSGNDSVSDCWSGELTMEHVAGISNEDRTIV